MYWPVYGPHFEYFGRASNKNYGHRDKHKKPFWHQCQIGKVFNASFSSWKRIKPREYVFLTLTVVPSSCCKSLVVIHKMIKLHIATYSTWFLFFFFHWQLLTYATACNVNWSCLVHSMLLLLLALRYLLVQIIECAKPAPFYTTHIPLL